MCVSVCDTQVCIPTTSGTGSEVTPFSVVTDEKEAAKYPLADYALTPHMAIVDPQLVMNIPKKLTAWGGIDALTHALESYVSIFASGTPSFLSLCVCMCVCVHMHMCLLHALWCRRSHGMFCVSV